MAWAKEVADIAQLSEEYVILDSVPVDLNLDREETLMFKRNYPKIGNSPLWSRCA